jgi:hypothetical protein
MPLNPLHWRSLLLYHRDNSTEGKVNMQLTVETYIILKLVCWNAMHATARHWSRKNDIAVIVGPHHS